MVIKLAVILSVLISIGVAAKTEIKHNTKYYSVEVAEAGELRSALQQSTPIIRSGNKFYAQTRYAINWTYNANVKNGFCKVGKPKVTAVIHTTLPKLESQNAAAIEKWEAWYTNLQAYQNKRQQHAVDTAQRLDKKLKKLKRQRHCDQLFKNATVVADEIIEDSLAEAVDYDEKTRYGYTEGAWSIFEN